MAPQVSEGCGWNRESTREGANGWGSAHGRNPLPERIPGHRDGTDDKRRNRVTHAGDGRARNHHGEGVAALCAYDRRDLPPAHQAIAFEGQVVDSVHYESVAGIEIGVAAASKNVRAVLHDDSVVVA